MTEPDMSPRGELLPTLLTLCSTRIAKGQLASWQQRKAMSMLGENLAEPISIDCVAAACRLSRAHFTRAFGASVGMAPYRWRMERRMALARQLLADTERCYPDVARACGFSKMSHFSHAFSQAVGMCPRRWRQRFGKGVNEGLSPGRMLRARAMLEDIQQPRAIREIALACGMNPPSFSRAFRAATGTTPRAWRIEARVGHAKRLLETTSLSMTRIAGECGFGEQAHFNHVFARVAHCSPGDWRRRHRAAVGDGISVPVFVGRTRGARAGTPSPSCPGPAMS
ncbi:MAG: AraC family transcriptional regulator [Luteibacter sp.]